jgi:hypothetical protein
VSYMFAIDFRKVIHLTQIANLHSVSSHKTAAVNIQQDEEVLK